jgi:hypothetical protein
MGWRGGGNIGPGLLEFPGQGFPGGLPVPQLGESREQEAFYPLRRSSERRLHEEGLSAPFSQEAWPWCSPDSRPLLPGHSGAPSTQSSSALHKRGETLLCPAPVLLWGLGSQRRFFLLPPGWWRPLGGYGVSTFPCGLGWEGRQAPHAQSRLGGWGRHLVAVTLPAWPRPLPDRTSAFLRTQEGSW